MQQENCVTFWTTRATKRNVSQDLLKIFGFVKYFWIANITCDSNLKNSFLLLICILLKFENFVIIQVITIDKSEKATVQVSRENLVGALNNCKIKRTSSYILYLLSALTNFQKEVCLPVRIAVKNLTKCDRRLGHPSNCLF